MNGAGVCDAYSRSFQYLMHRLEIPCVLIRGVSVRNIPHSWNAVFLDGKWYYVDITWDETNHGEAYSYHDYLLITEEEAAVSHFPQAGQYPSLPAASDKAGGYYARMGYSTALYDGVDFGAVLSRTFAEQLADRTITNSFQPVFLEIKLIGTAADCEAARTYFKDQLFVVLSGIEQEIERRGLPLRIRTTGSVGYQFNDQTRVLVLLPEVCTK